jgi:hypothetical protein
MKYTLTKMSSKGFSLETSDLLLIRDLLYARVCRECQKEYLPYVYPDMSLVDQVLELLATRIFFR